MSTQRVSSVEEIPVFDKENYGLWKKEDDAISSSGQPKIFGVFLKMAPKIPNGHCSRKY